MILLALVSLLLLDRDYATIQKKFDDIEQERYRSGTRVTLSPREINAYARQQAEEIAPKAVHDVQVVLGTDGATASARIDFLELNKAFGGQPNWMIEHLFQGVRPVKVTMKIQTRNGQARVDVDRVEISGAAVDGTALQFLIDHFVIPEFPDAKVAKWFPMSHRMDHVEVRPAGATVVIRK